MKIMRKNLKKVLKELMVIEVIVLTIVHFNLNKRLLYFLIACNIMSCNIKIVDSDIFNGDIKTIIDTVKTIVELEPHEIYSDGITYGFPTIYDSLIFFYNDKLPNMYYSVFNINTGKHIGDFCPKGQGPGEARVVSPIYQFYEENEELKTLLWASYNFKVIIWNISASINNNKTIWDFVPYDWRKDHCDFCNSYIASLNSKEFICKV
jgi:hypothetical protein